MSTEINKTAKYNPDKLPEDLRNSPRWALSTAGQVNKQGKPFSEKAPIMPIFGKDHCRGVQPNVPSSWASFDEVDAWQSEMGGYPGILLGPIQEGTTDPYDNHVGFDFDLQKADATLKAKVEENFLILCPPSAHIERSPSGNGYRVLIAGTIPRSRKTAAIEIYARHRFLRMTGDVVFSDRQGCGAHEGKTEEQTWIDYVYASLNGSDDLEEIEVTEAGDLTNGLTPEQIKAEHDAARAHLAIVDRGEVANYDRIDRGEGIGGSDDAMTLGKMYRKYTNDPALVLTLMLTNEGLQKHYADKLGDKAAEEINRKFSNHWWHDIEKSHVQWQARKDSDDALRPAIERLLAKSNADREARYEKEAAELLEQHAERAARLIKKSEERELMVVPPCPVPMYGKYAEWVVGAVAQTTTGLAAAATDAHLAAMCRNKVVGPSQTFANLYIMAIGPSGIGKNVLSSFTFKLGHGPNREAQASVLGTMRSDGAFLRKLGERGYGLGVVDEFGTWLGKTSKSGSGAIAGLIDQMKMAFGLSQLGSSTDGVERQDGSKSIAPTKNPAPTLLMMGTEDAAFDGIATHGILDGFLPRFIFTDDMGKGVTNRKPQHDMPADLITILSTKLSSIECLEEDEFIHIDWESEALADAEFKSRGDHAEWRMTASPMDAALTRTLYENTLRYATALAFWHEGVITKEIYDYAYARIFNSTMYIMRQADKGKFAPPTDRLKETIMEMVQDFYQKGAYSGPLAAAEKNRAAGVFTYAQLPKRSVIKTAANNVSPNDPGKAIKQAFESLVSEEILDKAPAAPKGRKGRRFVLGAGAGFKS